MRRSTIYLFLGGLLLVSALTWMLVSITNAEYRSRATQHWSAPTIFPVRVALLLHQFNERDNTVDVSLAVTRRTTAPSAPGIDSAGIRFELDDGSGAFAATDRATLTIPSLGGSPQDDDTGTTPRISLPVVTEVALYPFDDVSLYPVVRAQSVAWASTRTLTDIERRFPGRTMSVAPVGATYEIRLSRPVAEKALVLGSALTYLLAVTAVGAVLIRERARLRPIDEVVTFASYLVSITGFRALLGLDRVAGITVLEIVVFEVPLVALAFLLIHVAIRSWRHDARDPRERVSSG
jgi:hypothetical protein